MKTKFKYLALLSLPLLAACTGHPGAGKWQLSPSSDFQYHRLVVNFDGKAEFYKANDDLAWLHCFWTAHAADTIGLECASTNQEAPNEIFKLKVTTNQAAQLLIDDKIVASFVTQPVTN